MSRTRSDLLDDLEAMADDLDDLRADILEFGDDEREAITRIRSICGLVLQDHKTLTLVPEAASSDPAAPRRARPSLSEQDIARAVRFSQNWRDREPDRKPYLKLVPWTVEDNLTGPGYIAVCKLRAFGDKGMRWKIGMTVYAKGKQTLAQGMGRVNGSILRDDSQGQVAA